MRSLAALLLVLGVVACSPGDDETQRTPRGTPTDSVSPSSTGSTTNGRQPTGPTSLHLPPPATTTTTAPIPSTPPADPRWVFFTDDARHHTSPWFEGAWRVMIPFGCTPAPYYSPDPQCPGRQGFHHGVDVAMPCGTPLLAGRPATVLDGSRLGRAYGSDPVLLRIDGHDLVIGHTTTVLVRPGQQLRAGERFALAGDSGAPDGCHLHFELRARGGGVSTAVDPAALLALRPTAAG